MLKENIRLNQYLKQILLHRPDIQVHIQSHILKRNPQIIPNRALPLELLAQEQDQIAARPNQIKP
jgi:hypothetical protein